MARQEREIGGKRANFGVCFSGLAAVGLLGLLGFPNPISAAVEVDADPGVTLEVDTIEDTVFGDEMVGMAVTVTFSDFSTETLVWAAIDSPPGSSAYEQRRGGVIGDTWKLEQYGDSWYTGQPYEIRPPGPWTLTNLHTTLGIIGVTIDAIAGGIVFDRSEDFSSNAWGTPGSEQGGDFRIRTRTSFGVPQYPTYFFDDDDTILATYRNEVKLRDDPQIYGDIYGLLEIDLSAVTAPGSSVAGLQPWDAASSDAYHNRVDFFADTDMVPEPTGLAIWCALWALGWTAPLARRRGCG